MYRICWYKNDGFRIGKGRNDIRFDLLKIITDKMNKNFPMMKHWIIDTKTGKTVYPEMERENG